MLSRSKGKWIPGSLKSLRATRGNGYSFYFCDACDRGFQTHSGYEKHNKTELHFKRLSKSNHANSLLGKIRLGFDPLGESDGLANQRSRRNVKVKNYREQEKEVQKSDHVRCPTCYAYFHKQMMGKHLLSFFHCQKSEHTGRSSDPEKSLILENIHSIVALSPYQCKPCGFYFTRRQQLLHHFEKIHTNEFYDKSTQKFRSLGWVCSACRSRGVDAAGMMNHLKNSSEHAKMEAAIQKSIPIIIKIVTLRHCNLCNKKFLLNREVLSHQAQCPKRQLQSRKVEKIKLRDTVKKSMVRLQQKNAEAKDSLYKCGVCSFSTNIPSHLSRHQKIHETTRDKAYVCDICSSGFYEKFQLNYHRKIHTGKLFKCPHPGCSYAGRSNSEVSNHAVIHNENAKKFGCEKCDYKANSKSHLVRHFKLVHESRLNGIKKFKCDKCAYETNLPQGLKRHELTHTESKPFCCPYCDYTSNNIGNIRIHVVKRKVHSGAELYRCQTCADKQEKDSDVFKTNAFSEFKLHVVQNHSDKPSSVTENDIYIFAGLFKSV